MTGPMDVKKELREFYENEGITDYQEGRYKPGNYPANRIKEIILKFAKRLIGDSELENVLDVGSAEGLYARLLEKDVKCRYFNLDLSYNKVRRGLGYSHSIREIYFVCGDAQTLPFREAIFDLILCTELLEHLPDPKRAVKELWFVLRENGTFLLSVPTGKDRFHKIDKYEPDAYRSSGHLQEFSEKDVRTTLEDEGFVISRVVRIDILGEIRGNCNKFMKHLGELRRKDKQAGKGGEYYMSIFKKCFLRLYNQFWKCMDIFLLNLPVVKEHGHYLVLVCKKNTEKV